MNSFQRISQELVIEDLKGNGDLHSATLSDPVARLFIWQRLYSEQANANKSSQKAADCGAKGKDTN